MRGRVLNFIFFLLDSISCWLCLKSKSSYNYAVMSWLPASQSLPRSQSVERARIGPAGLLTRLYECLDAHWASFFHRRIWKTAYLCCIGSISSIYPLYEKEKKSKKYVLYYGKAQKSKRSGPYAFLLCSTCFVLHLWQQPSEYKSLKIKI